jgi:hypothetical protein
MATARAMLERRRSSRVRISIPLSVVRSEASQSNNTPAEAISISRYGALLRVPFLPPVGSRIELLHARSQEVREFRVISAKSPKVPGSFELGIEILHPTQNFWGVQLPEDRCSA